jgi:hypothetical protein
VPRAESVQSRRKEPDSIPAAIRLRDKLHHPTRGSASPAHMARWEMRVREGKLLIGDSRFSTCHGAGVLTVDKPQSGRFRNTTPTIGSRLLTSQALTSTTKLPTIPQQPLNNPLQAHPKHPLRHPYPFGPTSPGVTTPCPCPSLRVRLFPTAVSAALARAGHSQYLYERRRPRTSVRDKTLRNS